MIRIIFLLSVLSVAVAYSADIPNGNVADVEHTIVLQGTCLGGTVTLTFPSRTLQVNTTAGMTTVELASGFRAVYDTLLPILSDPSNAAQLRARADARHAIGFSLRADGNGITIQGLARGQVGLTSTDKGIRTLPSLGPLTAHRIDATHYKITWSPPVPATFDRINVYSSGSSEVTTLDGTASAAVDNLEFTVRTLGNIPNPLTFSAVGFSQELPSPVSSLTIHP